jgi:hypothetical protein
MKCTYCDREVPDDQASDEHVIPKGLASIEPTNPFILRTVCKRCNGKCGRHVDAPFLKSWMVHSYAIDTAEKFSVIDEKTTLPLRYMGKMEALRQGSRECDVWFSPSGDRIYHFHEPYSQDTEAPVGVGRPEWGSEEEFDPGYVFILIVTRQPIWVSVLVNSCFAQFEGSAFYLVNGATPSGKNRFGVGFSDIPSNFAPVCASIQAFNGKEHKLKVEISLTAPDRFMCKVALGLGALFLGPDFSNSSSASTLRLGLWTRSAKERDKIKLGGHKFISAGIEPLKKILDFPGCHVIGLVPLGKMLGLVLGIYGIEFHLVEVSTEPKHWSGSPQGIYFIIAPGLRTCVGPRSLPELAGHFLAKSDPSLHSDAELQSLYSRLASLPPQPSK